MKPFYWQGTTNFGDYLNSRIWPELLEGYLSEEDNIRLIGVGSLLKSSINNLVGKKVVFGTGSGYGAFPPLEDYKDWDFYFVRGPRTAAQFELPADKGLIDGAWLLSLLPQYENYHKLDKAGTIFIPHWNSADSGNWNPICKRADIEYVSPLAELDSILKKIACSELVITESLHGAIIADLFRVPWIPVNISPHFLAFKWIDWFESVSLNPGITDLPFSDFFEYAYQSRLPRNISYATERHSIEPEKMKTDRQAKKTQPAPGVVYRKKMALKRNLRETRRSMIAKASAIRDTFPLSLWNEKHRDKLSKTLREIAVGQRPYLSRDSVRSNKLERLQKCVAELKVDYDSGSLR